MIGSAWHRVEQFWRHSAGRVSPDEAVSAAAILGPRLYPLFAALPRNERRHGLDVLATLERLERAPDRILLQAALLHDMGKAEANLSVLDRSQAVFLRALSPGLLDAYLTVRPRFARRFRLYRDHAAIGARRLSDQEAVELAQIVAEHHAGAPSHPLTHRLQRADERN